MSQPCGCNGGSAPVAAGSAPVFTIQLPNGTKVGSYPTQDHARVANQTSYGGRGTVVPK